MVPSESLLAFSSIGPKDEIPMLLTLFLLKNSAMVPMVSEGLVEVLNYLSCNISKSQSSLVDLAVTTQTLVPPSSTPPMMWSSIVWSTIVVIRGQDIQK